MKTHATKVPLTVLNQMAKRSLECLVMSEDLPSPHNRVTVDSRGRIHVSWRRTNYDRHELLLARAKKILRGGHASSSSADVALNRTVQTAVAGLDPRPVSSIRGAGRTRSRTSSSSTRRSSPPVARRTRP